MLRQLIHHRQTVWYFALRQIQDRYAGTWGGLVWAVVHPVMLLAVFWFVFEKGLRITSSDGKPFVLQLFCGLVPWMFIQESIAGAAGAVTGRAYLVKKIAFPSEILPYTHVLAALLTHALLGAILFGMLLWYGRLPGAAVLMLPYYLGCMLVLVAGISVLLSAANVFYRDIGQFLGVALNLCFWITPIVWSATIVPPGYAWVVEFNPVAYVVQGYRDSLLEPSLRFPALQPTLWFWFVAGGIYLFAQRVFMRLKPSFADIL